MPILILSGPLGGPTGPTNSVSFTARSRSVITGSVLFVAQAVPQVITGSVGFVAQSLPLDPAPPQGGMAIEYAAALSGLPGPVLSWDYAHDGQVEDLTVVVRGLHGLATPTVGVSAEARRGNGTLLARMPSRVFKNFGQEPQEDVGAFRTTFRFRESLALVLKRDLLTEMIPWKLSPTLDPCLRVRQRVNISVLVNRVLRAYFDFRLETDPLTNAFFEEGRVDFSTKGLTPQGLWDATYGVLGMVLHSEDYGGGRPALIGRFPDPIDGRGGPLLPDHYVTDLAQGRELLQVPVRLTVTGREYVTDLKPEAIVALLAGDPAAGEVAREILPEQEWYDPLESAGTAQTQRGYRKSGGQMVSTIEITTDDIEVSETVGDEPFFRLWRGVATGYKRSVTTFDPLCPGRPLIQVTESKTWAFDAQTQGGRLYTYGPGLYRNLSTGDLASDETTVTTYRYSPQGFLAAKTTSTRRLASLEQVDADSPPEERGPLTAREYIVTTQTEQWRPSGGLWFYTPGVSGQMLVPVYDAESGEAMRTASIARTTPDAPRITDQAPPSYDCKDCGDKVEALDPTGIVFSTGDAGFADPLTVAVPFLDPSDLTSVGRRLLARDWGRMVTSLSSPLPLGFLPGSWLTLAGGPAGRVRETRISQAEGSLVVSTQLTVVKPDYLLGNPNSLTGVGVDADAAAGRAIMLARKPGGALARIVTGWNAEAGQPEADLGFIAYRTGFPPRPGDEIEWQFVNGRREATNAR